MEPYLASLHYLAVFSLAALLVAEFVLLRLERGGPLLRLLGGVDLAYGLAAIAVVATGLLRVFLGDQPSAHWGASHIFWTKMVIVLAIGLISVLPTVRYLAWNKAFAASAALPSDKEWRGARLWVHIQLGLLVLVPVLASFMAEAK